MENFDIKKYLKEHKLGPYGMLGAYVDLQPINEAEAEGGNLRLITKKTAAEIKNLVSKKNDELKNNKNFRKDQELELGVITKQSKGVRGEHDLIVKNTKENKDALDKIKIKYEKLRAYGETK